MRVVLPGVVLGIALAALRSGLGMDRGRFWRVYWAGAAVIVLGAVLVNGLCSLSCQKKIKQAAALLEAGDPEGYVRRIEELLRTARGNALRTVLRLDLSAGWCEQRRFDEAISLLEELESANFRGGGAEAVRRLNLCICYFESGRTAEGLELYHGSEALFAPWRKREIGGSLAALDVTAALAEGRLEAARALLERTGDAWTSPRLQREFQKLRSILEKAEGAAEKPPV